MSFTTTLARKEIISVVTLHNSLPIVTILLGATVSTLTAVKAGLSVIFYPQCTLLADRISFRWTGSGRGSCLCCGFLAGLPPRVGGYGSEFSCAGSPCSSRPGKRPQSVTLPSKDGNT